MWNYFLTTKTPAARRKLAKVDGYIRSLRILHCFSEMMKNDCDDAVVKVLQLDEIVKLLDDEYSRELDDGIYNILSLLDQLVAYDPSKGTDKLEKMRWIQKVN
jgi:hypothetical protein